MDDILRYCIITKVPLEFVCVSKTTRLWALDALSEARIACCDVVYYRVIQILGAAEMYTNLAKFTSLNFDKEHFKEKVVDLILRCCQETIKELYRYVKWFDRVTRYVMIEVAVRRLRWERIMEICEYLAPEDITSDPICNRASMVFLENTMEFDDTEFEYEYASRCVEFVATHYGDIINYYICSFIHSEYSIPLNNSIKCMILTLKWVEAQNNNGFIADAWRRVWQHDINHCLRELQTEVRRRYRMKTPLFNRLRRRAITDDEVRSAVYSNVMAELRVKVRMRGRSSLTPPDISKLRMLLGKK